MIWFKKSEVDNLGNEILYWENNERNRVYIVRSSFGIRADVYFNNELLKECETFEKAYLFIKEIVKNE